MAVVYKINKKCANNLKQLKDWEIAPYEWFHEDNVYYKIIEFDKKSEPVNYLFNVYNSENWQKSIYFGQDMKDAYKEIGIKFRKVNDKGNLRIIKNEEAYKFLCNWFLKINFNEENVWLCLTPSDLSIPEFYNADIIDRYCKEQIKDLLDFNIIEKVYVKDN